MRHSKARVLLAGILAALLVGCIGSETEPTAGSAHFARYFFIEPSDTGVLEVDTNPPSLCYSTQTFPARPIAVVQIAQGRVVASYTPKRAGYCDRSIDATIAKALVGDPSAFVVRWSPIPGDEVVDTPFGLGV